MSAGKAQQGRVRKEGFLSLCDEEIRSESGRQAVRVGATRARLPVEDCSLLLSSQLSTLGKAGMFADGEQSRAAVGSSGMVGHSAY